MRYFPSPNQNERDQTIRLQYIVLHYTGMKDAESALDRLMDPASRVSAHYVIDEDGCIMQLVSESKRAVSAPEVALARSRKWVRRHSS